MKNGQCSSILIKAQQLQRRMRGGRWKKETNLRAWGEEGDLLPGMGTSVESRGAWRPAWGRRRRRCCSYPPHRLPGPPAAQSPGTHRALSTARSRGHQAQFHQLSTSAERGLFCLRTSFHRSSCPLLLFWGPLSSCFPFGARVVSNTSRETQLWLCPEHHSSQP